MADITLVRNHTLGLQGARAAADKMADKLTEKFGLSGDWDGNTLTFARPGVSGKLIVTEHDMNLEVTLGFLLKAMKSPIERAVHEQLDAVLIDSAPAKKVAVKEENAAAKKPAPKKK